MLAYAYGLVSKDESDAENLVDGNLLARVFVSYPKNLTLSLSQDTATSADDVFAFNKLADNILPIKRLRHLHNTHYQIG